jgi:uncharacterized membrane protein YGL010W
VRVKISGNVNKNPQFSIKTHQNPILHTSHFKLKLKNMSDTKPLKKEYTYLEQQLIFYGSYHNNPINIIAHLICVPTINWTVMVWLAKLGNLLPEAWFGETFLTYFKPDFASLIGFSYITYYMWLDPIVAILFSLQQLPAIHYATKYAAQPGGFPLTIALFVLAWAVQIGAHKVYEKRAPALVDNAASAFSLAPFFLTLELMFPFGYRSDLYATMQAQVKENIREFKQKSQ